MTETTNSPTKPQACASCSRLASRVEELEEALREIGESTHCSASMADETLSDIYDQAQKALAGAHAEEK